MLRRGALVRRLFADSCSGNAYFRRPFDFHQDGRTLGSERLPPPPTSLTVG
jgi:hypothetical protein